MRNFLRALKFSWPYRWRIFFSILCALLVAVFWSLNFTAIYPVLKIIGSDQNLQEWVESSIKSTQDVIDPMEARSQELSLRQKELLRQGIDKPSPDIDRKLRQLAGELARLESKLQSSRQELYRYQVIKRYLDMLVPTDKFQTLLLVIGIVVAAVALKGLFEFWQEALVGNVVNLSLYDMRNRFYQKVIHLDVHYFSQSGTHELMARFTNDMELIGTGSKTLFGKVIAEPLRALACIVVACWISWQLTLLFLVLVPIALYVLTRVGRTMKSATRRQLERMSTIYKILQETFTKIRVVKAFTREPSERRRFRTATKEYYRKAMRVVVIDALAGPVIELLGVLGIGLALVAGAYLVLNKETHLLGLQMTYRPMEAEALLTLYGLLGALADPVRKLSSVFTKIQSGCAAADRVFNYMDRDPKIHANTQAPALVRHHKGIVFQDVCFSYDPGHTILSHVDLQVKFGEIIALVGKNGSGKSTLINLLPRFHDPDHGNVFIDGQNLRQANLRSLRQQIGMVTQDSALFDDTIYNNIAYGLKTASSEEVEAAARQAQAHDFILALPQGYQTQVGESGTKLSGGQKQRITLARALLRNPSILILDEFTSQTDVETEAEVHKFLRDFRKNRTIFVITHRLHTLEIADRIVFLENGQVLDVGTHQELFARCPGYQRLHEVQGQRLVA